jgi:hypothetical protein
MEHVQRYAMKMASLYGAERIWSKGSEMAVVDVWKELK